MINFLRGTVNTTSIEFQITSETQTYDLLNADCLDPVGCPSSLNFTVGVDQSFTGLSPGTRYGWEIYTRSGDGTLRSPAAPATVVPTHYVCTRE